MNEENNNKIEKIFSSFLIPNFDSNNKKWEIIASKLFESRKDSKYKAVSYFYFKKDANLLLAGLDKKLIDNFIEEFIKKSEEFINDIEKYYLDLKNLYEPQKRLILEYITECIFNLKQFELYKKLMNIILKINKKIFIISLEENKNDKNIQNLFKNILTLIQISDVCFRYNEENKNIFINENNNYDNNNNEEIISPLFRGETIIIELPSDFTLDDYYKLLGIHSSENKKLINYYFRASSHRILTKKDKKTKKEYSKENKISGISSGLDFHLLDKEVNYGIDYDIHFWHPEIKINENGGNRGHFLISFNFDFNKSRFLFKIEDCGYLKNSILGHEHGHSTARNYISPSVHFKILNPFINRKSLYCDLRKFKKDGIIQILKNINELKNNNEYYFGSKNNFYENVIKKYEIEDEIKKNIISPISGVKIYRKIDRNKKGNYFTENNVTYYGYIIENENEFKKWFYERCDNKEIYDKILILQNLWLYKCDSESKKSSECSDFFKNWNINCLPEIFLNDFNFNINFLINVYGIDSDININNYYQNFGKIKENKKIYFIFNNESENGKIIQNNLRNYFKINIEFNKDFDKIIFDVNSLDISKYINYIKNLNK